MQHVCARCAPRRTEHPQCRHMDNVRESMHGQNAKQHGFALCSCLWLHTNPCVLYVLEVENILMCDKMNREMFVLLARIAKLQTRYLHKLCKDSRGSSSMFVPFPLSAHKQ